MLEGHKKIQYVSTPTVLHTTMVFRVHVLHVTCRSDLTAMY